jgi:hypothetical protein
MLYFWHLIKYIELFFKTEIYISMCYFKIQRTESTKGEKRVFDYRIGCSITEALITPLEDGIRTVKKGREGIYN